MTVHLRHGEKSSVNLEFSDEINYVFLKNPPIRLRHLTEQLSHFEVVVDASASSLVALFTQRSER